MQLQRKKAKAAANAKAAAKAQQKQVPLRGMTEKKSNGKGTKKGGGVCAGEAGG
jgi:hypothetical protein